MQFSVDKIFAEMPKLKKSREQTSYEKKDVKKAVAKVHSRQSLRKVAAKLGIPVSILHNKVYT